MDLGPLGDMIAGVFLAAGLAAVGWILRELFVLTGAISSLTATIESLSSDHDDRIERLENTVYHPQYGRRATDVPPPPLERIGP